MIVGTIADFISPKDTTTGKRIMKGHIHTPGHIIPFILWNEVIDRHAAKIKAGKKYVFQNIYAVPFNTRYDSSSTVLFQATIVANTILTEIGNAENEEVNSFIECELENLGNMDGLVGMFFIIVLNVLISTFQILLIVFFVQCHQILTLIVKRALILAQLQMVQIMLKFVSQLEC